MIWATRGVQHRYDWEEEWIEEAGVEVEGKCRQVEQEPAGARMAYVKALMV